jgi:hypothetical protein
MRDRIRVLRVLRVVQAPQIPEPRITHWWDRTESVRSRCGVVHARTKTARWHRVHHRWRSWLRHRFRPGMDCELRDHQLNAGPPRIKRANRHRQGPVAAPASHWAYCLPRPRGTAAENVETEAHPSADADGGVSPMNPCTLRTSLSAPRARSHPVCRGGRRTASACRSSRSVATATS